jgi:hypothetical protein
MAKSPTNTQRTVSHAAADIDREQIRIRAYELYEARGRGDGHDLEDWLEAEAELTDRTEMTQAA